MTLQPIAEIPPVPSGPVAVDAWRELDRATRKELLYGDRPHADPAVAVLAVGYARAMLARPVPRRQLPFALAITAVAVLLMVAGIALDVAAGIELGSATIVLLTVATLLPLLLVRVIFLRRRTIALHRMERVNAARLWRTERAAPPPRDVPPGSPAIVVRYSGRALARSLVPLAAIVLGVEALVWSMAGNAIAALVTALLVVSVALLAYNVRFRVRPHLPLLTMSATGLEFPSMGARLGWTDVTEVQIHPFRGGQSRAKERSRSIAFMLADPDAFTSQLAGWWLKKMRTPLSVYGTPLVLADTALDHSAEEMAAAAATYINAPVRRFGP